MKYRTLGNSGLTVSKLALGTMYFGSQNTEEEAFALLDAFTEAGGNLLDTSNVYSGSLSEQIIGRWLAARPTEVTDRVVLTSKGRYTTGPDVNDLGLSRRHLTRALDASLHRLGVETIDLYQMHGWDPHTPVEETLSFLDDAIRAGKIHYAGLSNFTGWQLQLTVSTARAMGVHVPLTLQHQYSLLSRESEFEMVPAALHNNIGLLPWSPLAGGFLTGKYQRHTTPAPDTRAGSDNPLYRYVSAKYSAFDRNWATIAEVVRIADETGATPAQVALSWIADRPGVTAPIFGARTLDQLHDSIAAADLTLDDEATIALDQVSTPTPGDYPYGPFGTSQRDRRLRGGDQALGDLVGQGSDHPLGRP
ncbi:aryl-alcohol dehydrogenase-like predicted oxidoreductase [Streptomyces africanus]|uniref:Aryl-alcohol dehydrogenase-like predicted oxidoreductase n=1 Tax=Streptomyces africanus TaxID=231024 RepID=A0ABU0R1K7_9ACTN|nr:aldo/keto reductase [Streptomyces africanus]MDQ0753541.1 aryl-alcohol dehydrogenase-like predicted oxidoreductase [Streptomyces africanus]